MKQQILTVKIGDGQDQITLDSSKNLYAIGCYELLNIVTTWRDKIVGPVEQWPLPEGVDHASLLLKELLLKAQGLWEPPIHEDPICRCCGINRSTIDRAILFGAHDIDQIRKVTMANTACGSCLPSLIKMVQHRLGLPSQKMARRKVS